MQIIDGRRKKTRNRENSSGPAAIGIHEGDLHAKTIITDNDRLKAHYLRHRIFCEELGWVQSGSDRQEADAYDNNAVFFGVFDGRGNLKAYLRVVLSTDLFMLEKEFCFLLSDSDLVRKEPDTIEISRLCVAPEARSDTFSGNFGVHSASMLLYKSVYHWCLKNGKRYVYMVVEQKIFRLLCSKGFPCQLVGEPRKMSDGVVAVAALLDWRRFEEKSAGKRMMSWFSEYRSSLPTMRLRQHGYGLRHQV